MPHDRPRGGRHENGQNLLTDPRVVRAIVHEVAGWPPGPIAECAAGRGSLTLPLAGTGRPVTAVELDPSLAAALRARAGRRVRVDVGDMLRHPLPATGGVVANVPFHLTTPWLRRLLDADGWERALLLVQWEVARKRAGVGGTTLLTARWWPWYDFALRGRVPAAAFRPRPSVDGGLLRVVRRSAPLLPAAERAAYQRLLDACFTGPGRGVGAVVARATGRRGGAAWMRRSGIDPRALPRDLGAGDWVRIHRWAMGGP